MHIDTSLYSAGCEEKINGDNIWDRAQGWETSPPPPSSIKPPTENKSVCLKLNQL